MVTDVLSPPDSRWLLDEFRRHFRINDHLDRYQQLTQVARAFSQIPYENLSKIIRFAEAGSAAGARETPAEIVRGYRQWGTGGTCFSLTATLLYLVRSMGYQAEPILADRSYGPDTHCALVVWIDQRPHLLDPGYLLTEPIDLSGSMDVRVATGFHEVRLVHREGTGNIDLLTRDGGGERGRLTFKTGPVDSGQFLRAWDASFAWDMMRYPVLTRVMGERQLYQRARYHQVRNKSGVQRQEIAPQELAARIAADFGLDPLVIHRAFEIWQRTRTFRWEG